MRYLSFVTEDCKKTAKKHSLFNEIENLSSKIERDQSVQVWDSFLPTPYIKKDFARSYRVIASKHPMQEENVIVVAFLLCLPRGGSGEYDKFVKNPSNYGERYLPDTKEIKKYIESRKESLPASSPKIKDFEREFLYTTLDGGTKSDTIIYESADWVEKMKNKKILEESTRLYDSLKDISNNPNSDKYPIYTNERSNVSIYYHFFPKHNILFLISPLLSKEDSIESLKSKYMNILENKSINDFHESLLKNSRRSYPSYILADEPMWKAIQKNEVGNLALSPEESDILNNITYGNSEKLFPLFINGRPGSGKSTILQYLFASYIHMFLNNDIKTKLNFPPIYLTYNEDLLESAQANIKAVLTCNLDLKIDEDEYLSPQIYPKCFGVFHKFLLDLLPEKSKNKFDLNKKIDFPRFRNLWENKQKSNPDKKIRKLNSELAWHVLRSYIKGMRYDDESDFSPEKYLELPNNQKTVEFETFKNVYNNIWQSWYLPLCEKDGFWDDQDLVLQVLNEPNIKLSRYPAIFCDEAQDFSKLELDLILQLSLYYRRSLSSDELKRVPFAFAGDPFQTLNPTGFEWESLQANFHEKIVSGLDKFSSGKLEFNYQELSYNYRSTKHITGLCNLIQLLRGILFNQKGLLPQKTWFDADASIPALFNVKDTVCEKKLQEQTELVIILPCQEGEEEDYVKNDDFLSSIATSEVDIRNFLSPMRAKGLEFSRVVLYKFGKSCLDYYPNLFDPLEKKESHPDNTDKILPFKYFMNRLYVGTSRAKSRLIIVDDDEGINTLWNNDLIKSFDYLLKLYPNAEKLGWTPSIINYVQEGIEDNWTEDRDDPLFLAEEFYTSGLNEKDPYKLRLAEANYQRCKQPANAKLCKAKRYELEKQYSEAGELYLEIRDKKKSLACYWSAGDFSIIANNNAFSNKPEQRAAIFYLGNKSEAETEQFLQFLLGQLKDEQSFKIAWDPNWKQIYDACMDVIIKFPRKSNFRKLYTLIRAIEKNHLKPSENSKYAEISYLANDFEYAVKLWESASTIPENKKEYCLAKAHTLSYPSNLYWLNKTKDYEKILQERKENEKVLLDDKNASIVAKSLLELSQYDYLINFLKEHLNEDSLKEAYHKFKKNNLEIHQEKAGQLLLNKYAKLEKWKDIVELIHEKQLSKSIRTVFVGFLACEIAKRSDFRQNTVAEKNTIGELFKKFFIDSSWENIVSMRTAGAAIENAYKIIDALDFYEGVWKKKKIPAEKKDIDYAVARWVKSKIRLAEFLENTNKEGGGKHREEAEKVCREKLGINKEKIPDDPEFDLEETMQQFIQKSNTLDIPQKTQEAIITLYHAGWKPNAIAESLRCELQIVEETLPKSV